MRTIVMPPKLRQPKAIVFDVSSTIIKAHFPTDVLMKYFRQNLPVYLSEHWDDDETQRLVNQVLKRPGKGKSRSTKQPTSSKKRKSNKEEQLTKEKQIKGLCDWVSQCQDKCVDPKELSDLRLAIWMEGYQSKLLVTPVYEDVGTTLARWKNKLDIRLFTYSSGWWEMTRRFLSNTNSGDLDELFEMHYDSNVGALSTVTNGIGEKPQEILLLTKKLDQAEQARKCSLRVVLVRRADAKIEPTPGDRHFPVVKFFSEIEFVE